jgi:hypothetical protein
MPTFAAISADLLRDAATFFRTLAEQNELVRKQMTENAGIYDHMANLIEKQPRGVAPDGITYSELSARLLRDTAKFYRTLAVKNEPIREQMEYNADIYDQIADEVSDDPMGVME